MRYLIVVLLAMLAMPVQANHHRAHAAYFLDDVWPRFGYLRKDMREMKLVDEFADPVAQQRYERIGIIIRENLRLILELREIITREACGPVQSKAMLGEARRAVNRPTKIQPGGPANLAFNTGRLHYRMAQFLAVTQPGEIDLKIFAASQRRLADAWREVEFILWHVNDAYREDVYGEGAGHDPDIDPVGFGQDYIFNPCDGLPNDVQWRRGGPGYL